jgi:hypothetical protein
MKISNTESDAFIVTIDELTQKNEALLGALEQLHEKCTLLLEVISNDTAWTVSQMNLRSNEEFAVDRMSSGGSVND